MELVAAVAGQSERIHHCVYLPEVGVLVTASEGTLQTWSHTPAPTPTTLVGHLSSVHSVLFGADGAYLLSTSSGARCPVVIWDPESGAPLGALRFPDRRGSYELVALHPERRLAVMALGDSSAPVGWGFIDHADLHRPRWIETRLTGAVRSLAFRPAGDLLVVGSQGHLESWAPVTPGGWEDTRPRSRLSFGNAEAISLAFVEAGGFVVALASRDEAPHRLLHVAVGEDGSFAVQHEEDLGTSAAPTTLCATRDPGGCWLAVGFSDGSIRLWRTTPGEAPGGPRFVLGDVHHGDVRALRLLPTENQLVSAGGDRIVRFWDLDSGSEHFALHARLGAPTSFSFDPMRRTLAYGSSGVSGRDNVVYLLEADTDPEVLELRRRTWWAGQRVRLDLRPLLIDENSPPWLFLDRILALDEDTLDLAVRYLRIYHGDGLATVYGWLSQLLLEDGIERALAQPQWPRQHTADLGVRARARCLALAEACAREPGVDVEFGEFIRHAGR